MQDLAVQLEGEVRQREKEREALEEEIRAAMAELQQRSANLPSSSGSH